VNAALSATTALDATELWVGVAVLVQSLEYWNLRHHQSPSGTWAWSLLREEYAGSPRVLRALLDRVFAHKPFLALVLLRGGAAAVGALWSAGALAFALESEINQAGVRGAPALVAAVVSVLVSLRWRGAFNGGSDAMTLAVLCGVAIARFSGPGSLGQSVGLGYVAAHALNSYFIAGWVKLADSDWRSGRALPQFLRGSQYRETSFTQRLLGHPAVSVLASWGVMLFEVTFPCALLSRHHAAVFLAAGLGFHVLNARVLGLNRFLWAWSATYPALFYYAGRVV
jgi:hypothetical protein